MKERNKTMELNMKQIKDCKEVARIGVEAASAIKNFFDNLKLMSHEKELLAYVSTRKVGVSPEAASDPENLAFAQKRYETNISKLERISKFKSGLLAGEYKCETPFFENNYIMVFGKRIELSACYKSFDEFHDIAKAQLIGIFESFSVYTEYNPLESYPDDVLFSEDDDKCDGDCGNCSGNLHVHEVPVEEEPEEIKNTKSMIASVLGISPDDIIFAELRL